MFESCEKTEDSKWFVLLRRPNISWAINQKVKMVSVSCYLANLRLNVRTNCIINQTRNVCWLLINNFDTKLFLKLCETTRRTFIHCFHHPCSRVEVWAFYWLAVFGQQSFAECSWTTDSCISLPYWPSSQIFAQLTKFSVQTRWIVLIGFVQLI